MFFSETESRAAVALFENDRKSFWWGSALIRAVKAATDRIDRQVFTGEGYRLRNKLQFLCNAFVIEREISVPVQRIEQIEQYQHRDHDRSL